jgi:hypothetical protein
MNFTKSISLSSVTSALTVVVESRVLLLAGYVITTVGLVTSGSNVSNSSSHPTISNNMVSRRIIGG